MNASRKNTLIFFIALSIFAVLCWFAYFSIYVSWPETPEATYIELILIATYLVTLIAFFIQTRVIMKNPDMLLQIIMLALIVRLILFGALNFYMIYTDIEHAKANVIAFFAVYACFTVFELSMLFPQMKRRS